MIRLVQAEERRCPLRARPERAGPGLDDRAGDLVLQSLAGQAASRLEADDVGVAIGRAEQLHRVRGEAGRAIEATMRDPWVAAVLRQVLPAQHHRPAAGMPGDVVVDVLRRVRLVVHEEAAFAQADVLDEDRIARHFDVPGVRDLEAPQPEIVPGMQPKRDAVPHAAGGAVPGEAVVTGAEADHRAGPERLRNHRLRPAEAEVQPGDAAVQRGALHLIDHGPAALVPMLDGEHAGVGQNGDRQPGLVADPAQTEIGLAGRLEGAGGGVRHRDLPSGRKPWQAPG